MGGRVGLKGTDDIVGEAYRRGAKPLAEERAGAALRALRGWCQTDSNRSQFGSMPEISGGAELTPLGKGGRSVELEFIPAIEVAFLVEVVVHGGVDGGAGLQTSHAPETEHRPLPSSHWQM